MNKALNPTHIAPPPEFAAQVETVMQNLTEILKSGGMDWGDVVKFTGYLTALDG